MYIRPSATEIMGELMADAMKDRPSIDIISMCGGYYECPKDEAGKRLGPLVGYAGRYTDPSLESRQYVGDVYVNFASVERYGFALDLVAQRLLKEISSSSLLCDGFCGAPEGGKALAAALAIGNSGEYLFPEKKTISLATAVSREKSMLQFQRHEPEEGSQLLIVEDVCNNFSTTAELIDLIHGYGATVIGVACFLNRSSEHADMFEYTSAQGHLVRIPVISLVKKPFPQYQQDHPDVSSDIIRGNVVWKPKNEWSRLMYAMRKP